MVSRTRKQKRNRKVKGGAYNIATQISTESLQKVCTIETYKLKTGAILKKFTCLTEGNYYTDKARFGARAYGYIYKWLKDQKSPENSQIVFDENNNPIGYFIENGTIIHDHASPLGPYAMGPQIGMEEQMDESEDSLYIEANNPDLIVKKLTGGGKPSNKVIEVAVIFRDIYKEIALTKVAADLGVGPRVLYSKIVSGANLKPIGYIVMERIHGKYITEPPANSEPIHKLMEILFDNGIEHGDTHNRNILYGHTQSQPEDKYWIIDYGDAENLSEKIPESERRYVISMMSEEHPDAPLKPIYI
jgi:hypothetical protein